MLQHQRRTHHSASIMKMNSIQPFVLDGFFALRSERDINHRVLCTCMQSTAKLFSLFWRWRTANSQSYTADLGAGETSTGKAIFPTLALANAGVQSYLPYFGWRSADLQSYIPDLGAGEASTSKAIFPTLELTNADGQSG